MLNFAKLAVRLLKKNESEIQRELPENVGIFPILRHSVRKLNHSIFLLFEETPSTRRLLIISDYPRVMPTGFDGEMQMLPDRSVILCCPCNAQNAAMIRQYFPWSRPRRSRETDCVVRVAEFPIAWQIGQIRNSFMIFPDLTVATFDCFAQGAEFPMDGYGVGTDSPDRLRKGECTHFYHSICPAAGGDLLEDIGEYQNRRFIAQREFLELDENAAKTAAAAYGAVLPELLEMNQLAESVGADVELVFDHPSVAAAGVFYLLREMIRRGGTPKFVRLPRLHPLLPAYFPALRWSIPDFDFMANSLKNPRFYSFLVR